MLRFEPPDLRWLYFHWRPTLHTWKDNLKNSSLFKRHWLIYFVITHVGSRGEQTDVEYTEFTPEKSMSNVDINARSRLTAIKKYRLRFISISWCFEMADEAWLHSVWKYRSLLRSSQLLTCIVNGLSWVNKTRIGICASIRVPVTLVWRTIVNDSLLCVFQKSWRYNLLMTAYLEEFKEFWWKGQRVHFIREFQLDCTFSLNCKFSWVTWSNFYH